MKKCRPQYHQINVNVLWIAYIKAKDFIDRQIIITNLELYCRISFGSAAMLEMSKDIVSGQTNECPI